LDESEAIKLPAPHKKMNTVTEQYYNARKIAPAAPSLKIQKETAMAVLVIPHLKGRDESEAEPKWLPKSQIKIRNGAVYSVRRWLAQKEFGNVRLEEALNVYA